MDESESEATKKREEKIVNSICSFQSRLGPPEYRKWRRVHGLQLPLHPQQIMGWLVLLGVGAATFLVLVPALTSTLRDCLLVVLAALFLLHVLSHLAALLLDPADPELRALKVTIAVPEFDRAKHAHVIENGRCHLCNIKTSTSKTKHCSVCNKCVDHFDHHCKWLNHCVGGRNYVAFLICVISAVVAALVVVAVSIMELVYYHVDPACLSFYPDRNNSTETDAFLSEPVFLGVVSVLGLLAATTAGLLLHLCLFHCYISILGITTYEYIRNYRQGTSATQIIPRKCTCRKAQVTSSHQDNNGSTQTTSKVETPTGTRKCYYSCSRPPEDETVPEKSCYCCPYEGLCFGNKSGRGRRKGRTLERQNTDPEFIDRVVKPFVITFNDERRPQVPTPVSNNCIHLVAKSKCCVCSGRTEPLPGEKSKSDGPFVTEPKKVIVNLKRTGNSRRRLSLGKLWVLCPKSVSRNVSRRGSDNVNKIKCNQIRPSTEEEINRALEKIAAMTTEKQLEAFNLKLNSSSSTVKVGVLPELAQPVRKLKNVNELKEIKHVINFAEQPNLALQHNMRPMYRRSRKKNLMRRPRSPSLSPIRESGLSNPGSPRVDLASPQLSPVLTPKLSTIFLSNPNSPCSSDEDVVSPITTQRYSNSEDILKTPQLPRKTYSSLETAEREEQVFMLKAPKQRPVKWIQMSEAV